MVILRTVIYKICAITMQVDTKCECMHFQKQHVGQHSYQRGRGGANPVKNQFQLARFGSSRREPFPMKLELSATGNNKHAVAIVLCQIDCGQCDFIGCLSFPLNGKSIGFVCGKRICLFDITWLRPNKTPNATPFAKHASRPTCIMCALLQLH